MKRTRQKNQTCKAISTNLCVERKRVKRKKKQCALFAFHVAIKSSWSAIIIQFNLVERQATSISISASSIKRVAYTHTQIWWPKTCVSFNYIILPCHKWWPRHTNRLFDDKLLMNNMYMYTKWCHLLTLSYLPHNWWMICKICCILCSMFSFTHFKMSTHMQPNETENKWQRERKNCMEVARKWVNAAFFLPARRSTLVYELDIACVIGVIDFD